MSLEERILFIDGEAIVIDKPAGLAVDPPRAGGDSVTARLGELKLGFQREPVAMHRLDRDTSGCLLLARNPKAVKRFQQAFEGGMVEKTYLAAVDGIPPGADGIIELPLAKVSTPKDGWRMVPDEGGKAARTAWRLIGQRDEQSLVEFRPLTGRTHQIRVHAARGLGAAIIGDPIYSELGDNPEQPMLLHSWKLKVPRAGKPPIEVVAPVPDSFGLWHDFLPGDE
ncbi:RNA pseudouridine synthase [Sphingomonas sp. HDW15A]|uniref:RluA family pseudouridine synthase n=1 Tax=Sphingomonas sp. HDW15A TaxID=2714942 RepID=UPI00140ADD72|nr:RNA pseudouridine synthase [Sphingomonas sp. HDW15A]QIK96548.1 RNA pseudouridine synthase [Sphingomonas sp. HDW15A]